MIYDLWLVNFILGDSFTQIWLLEYFDFGWTQFCICFAFHTFAQLIFHAACRKAYSMGIRIDFNECNTILWPKRNWEKSNAIHHMAPGDWYNRIESRSLQFNWIKLETRFISIETNFGWLASQRPLFVNGIFILSNKCTISS